MPNTTHGLPYPAATDPVAQGAAAIQALAQAVDAKLGKYLLFEQTLAAEGNLLGWNAIPAGFRAIEFEALGVTRSGVDRTVCDVLLDLQPIAGAGNFTYGAIGQSAQASGAAYASNSSTVPVGRMIHFGAGVPNLFIRGALSLGYDAAQRHGLHWETIGRQDVNGNGGDVCMTRGGAEWRANSPYVAITGLTLTGSTNFGIGSRLAVYGVL